METEELLTKKDLNRIKGSLFGGACGDALGYPVEFSTLDAIKARYGNDGITGYEYDPKTGLALISDDTQMTLFTANGILCGFTRNHFHKNGAPTLEYVAHAYKDWMFTQDCTMEEFEKRCAKGYFCNSWLCDVPEMFSQRAPGNTCMSALHQAEIGSISHPINNSKGCGGLMRVAPLAMYNCDMDFETLDRTGAEIAALTHGHSLGYMPAAVLTHILSRLIYPQGTSYSFIQIVREAMDAAERLFPYDAHFGTLRATIERAIELTSSNAYDYINIHRIGPGMVAEETLAIAIYCCLKYPNDFSKGIIAAVNHDGDSDSTGCITGQILGAMNGYDAIDKKWLEKLELSDVINEIAEDMAREDFGETSEADPLWISKYVHANRTL